jgi:hypothetical protein
MVNIPVIRLIVILCTMLFMASCATQKDTVPCPSFEGNRVKKIKKYKKRVQYRNMKFVSIKKRNWSQKKRPIRMNKHKKGNETFTQVSRDAIPNLLASIGVEKSILPAYMHESKNKELNQNNQHETIEGDLVKYRQVKENQTNNQHKTVAGNVVKIQKTKGNQTNNNNMKNRNTLETKSGLSEMYSAADTQNKQKRKTARTIGGALLLMAVLAGISIPAVGSLAASIGLVGVFLLDVLVSLGIIKYHKKEKPKLAKKSGILRLIYTAFLGVGIGYSFGGNVSMFNSIWGVGLIVFGVHLISLGILFNNNGGKKWVNILIKSLLIAAGIGYIIQYVGILLVPNPIGFAAAIETIFILPMILGEVSYALWMLIKGGKVKSK